VSHEADLSREQAAEVQAGAECLAESMNVLRTTIARVVRTSINEANRRRQTRFAVDPNCHVRSTDGKTATGRITDISGTGASILGHPGLQIGSEGWLVVTSWAEGAETKFRVRGSQPPGSINVEFVLETITLPMQSGLESIQRTSSLVA
jgi:hypothetical protein